SLRMSEDASRREEQEELADGGAQPDAAAAAATATPAAGSTPVQPAPPGQIIKRRVILKRTMKGPNGPHIIQTHATMTINDKGEKNYYTIPSPGGTSKLITTVGAPDTTAGTIVRQTPEPKQQASAVAAATAAAATPAAKQQPAGAK
ncbi:hypothetical protein PENTCL1PPCAC_9673, partial [Pristionchus entomophagus]